VIFSSEQLFCHKSELTIAAQDQRLPHLMEKIKDALAEPRVFFGLNPCACLNHCINESRRFGKYDHDGPNGKYISLFIFEKITLEGLNPYECKVIKWLASIEIGLVPVEIRTVERCDNTPFRGEWENTSNYI
jgi:hypothetical protein